LLQFIAFYDCERVAQEGILMKKAEVTRKFSQHRLQTQTSPRVFGRGRWSRAFRPRPLQFAPSALYFLYGSLSPRRACSTESWVFGRVTTTRYLVSASLRLPARSKDCAARRCARVISSDSAPATAVAARNCRAAFSGWLKRNRASP